MDYCEEIGGRIQQYAPNEACVLGEFVQTRNDKFDRTGVVNGLSSILLSGAGSSSLNPPPPRLVRWSSRRLDRVSAKLVIYLLHRRFFRINENCLSFLLGYLCADFFRPNNPL